MDRDKVLLITSTGLVGGNMKGALEASSYNVVDTYYPGVDQAQGLPVDISLEVSVQNLFSKVLPSVVILSGALTNVEFCQENRDVAWKTNVIGTQNVVKACKACGAKLVFFLK